MTQRSIVPVAPTDYFTAEVWAQLTDPLRSIERRMHGHPVQRKLNAIGDSRWPKISWVKRRWLRVRLVTLRLLPEYVERTPIRWQIDVEEIAKLWPILYQQRAYVTITVLDSNELSTESVIEQLRSTSQRFLIDWERIPVNT